MPSRSAPPWSRCLPPALRLPPPLMQLLQLLLLLLEVAMIAAVRGDAAMDGAVAKAQDGAVAEAVDGAVAKSTQAAEGWSLERMLEVYGESERRSVQPTWPVLRPASDNGGDGGDGDADSWLGGMSQYYGAGGVSPIDHSAGVLVSHFNGLVPGFGESGARSLRPRPNTSLDDAALRARNTLLNHVETTLWAASILRDNMVTVFGYVLNLPGNQLNADLYTSLYSIYEEVRYRRFQTVPLVQKLKDICRASPMTQFKSLFRAMEPLARPYIKSAIEFWSKSLEDEDIDVDEILRPDGGPLIVDFLEGIDPSVVKLLKHPPKFPKETKGKADSNIKELSGEVVASTLTSITDGTLPLTQTLFALLLQLRPSDIIIPQKMELERYLSDSLRLRKVQGWRAIVKRAEDSRARGSYIYARAILWALSESSEVEPTIQDAARLVYTYIKPPIVTYSNPEYNYTSSIMSRPTIDILHFLKAITPYEYPEDVVDTKNRLKFYIEAGHLDMEFVVKGFNRFDHVKPVNLVIAILTRIEMRLPELPEEIRSSVKYLKSYLIFKKFLCSMSPIIPPDFLESPFLLDSFQGPTMPKWIRGIVVNLEARLRKERLPVASLIAQTSVEECSRPRQCILNILRRIVKNDYISSRTKDLMINLITSVDIHGEPLAPSHTPEYEVKTAKKKRCSRNRKKQWDVVVLNSILTSNRSTPANPVTSPKPIRPPWIVTTSRIPKLTGLTTVSKPATTRQPRVSVSDISTTVRTTVQPETEEVDGEEHTIYPGAPEPPFLFPIYSDVEINQKPDISNPTCLLPYTEIGTAQDTIIRPIREFLKHPQLYLILGKSFRPEVYKTKITVLTAILKRAIFTKIVKFNSLLYNTMKEFLLVLQSIPRRPQTIHKSVFPNVTDAYEHSPVNYEEPYKNLPRCTANSVECDSLHPIHVFLSDENVYYKLGPYFRPNLYKTKGTFIKYLLQHAMKQKCVQKNVLLYKTIKQFLSKLQEIHISPSEVKNTPFPKGDTVKDNEPPNWKHPLTLLPTTIPGTAEHVKMRPLWKFFSRVNFWAIMGSNFQANDYHTKRELLAAIISHALTIPFVTKNSGLYNLLREYNVFLKISAQKAADSGEHSITINLQTLVNALPYPETTEEELHLRRIRELFRAPSFFALMRPVMTQAIDRLRTRGAVLQLVLQEALRKPQLQMDNDTLQTLQYFKDRVIYEGYGAQSVDYVVLKQKKQEQVAFSVLDLFRAIDHSRLSIKDRIRVKRVIHFVSFNFDPNKYLSGFQSEVYNKKGTFLKAAFRHMVKLQFLRPRIKSDMQFLKGYIMETGPGAEVIHVKTKYRSKWLSNY